MAGNDEIVPGFDDEETEGLEITLEAPSGDGVRLVVLLSGEIGPYNAYSFKNRVMRAIDSGFVELILDMREVGYIASPGIGALTAFLRATRPRGGDIVLVGMSARVYEAIELLGFSQFLKSASTVEEAIGVLGAGRGDSPLSIS
jgi:anti-anti-sigma factor